MPAKSNRAALWQWKVSRRKGGPSSAEKRTFRRDEMIKRKQTREDKEKDMKPGERWEATTST